MVYFCICTWHIFWNCPHTQIFWIEFSNVINRNVLQGFSLFFKDVLFNSTCTCYSALAYKKIKLMNILLLTYYYFLLNFIFTAVNSLIKILYLLFLKKSFNSISKLFHLPRILKLSKLLIYFIFLTYSVKALFWIIYCYMHVETVLCR